MAKLKRKADDEVTTVEPRAAAETSFQLTARCAELCAPPVEGVLPSPWPPAPVPTEAAAPALTALTPNTAVSGGPDFVLHISGGNFSLGSVIYFGRYAEPTTMNPDGSGGYTLSTTVKPSLFAPATVPVTVLDGGQVSNALNFTFTAPAGP